MSLLDNVTEQKDKVNVAFDSDGIIYLSCYKYRESGNIELMYIDFWMRIASIEAKIWESFAIDNTVIALTTKKNFRHSLTDRWKDDRKAKPESEMTEKQLESHRDSQKLRTYVSQVKVLLNKRMASSPSYKVLANNVAEADDTVIDLANNQGYLVVAMDGDVIEQCTEPVFNYHKKYWKFIHQGRLEEDVFRHIIFDTITGGHNGSFGVKGKGKVFAEKFLDKVTCGEKTFEDWVNLFETPEDALLNYRVADCSQVVNGKLKLMDMISIGEKWDEYFEPPF